MSEAKSIILCPKCGTQLLEGSQFCLKCGTPVGVLTSDDDPTSTESNEVNIEIPEKNTKKKLSKGKVALCIILIIGLLLGGVVGTFIYLLNTGYLYENGYIKKIYELTGQCLEHHYSEATCLLGETCEICGNVNSPELGHDWSEATCDTAKTCKRCYEVEGSPLGHTTQMGKCDNCGDMQCDYEKELVMILNYCGDASDYTGYALDMLNGGYTTVYGAYLACSSASRYYSSAKKEFQKAYDVCGDIEEFKTLKSKIKAMMDALPTTAPSNSKSSVQSYASKVDNYTKKFKDYADYVIDATEEWGFGN